MTRTGKSAELLAAEPEPFLEVHPDGRQALWLTDRVRVVSRRGAVTLKVRVTDAVRPGTVFAPFHWGALHAPAGAGGVNDLTHRETDPFSRQPGLKATAVRLEPVASARRKRRKHLLIVGAGPSGRGRRRDRPGARRLWPGAVPARARQSELVEQALPKVELATLLLVALIVGVHFRALGAPLLTLGAVAAAYLTSSRLIAWIGERIGISMPSEVEPVIVVLLFGVITDYAIFFLASVRERLAQGEPKHEAVTASTARLLPIIVTAGLTVAGASAALGVAELGFFRAFGPGMAMSILIGLAVAVTLIPAGLAIGGRFVFWPSRFRRSRLRGAGSPDQAGREPPSPLSPVAPGRPPWPARPYCCWAPVAC